MIQNIIVFVILAATAVYSVFAMIKSLRKKVATDCESGCDGCTGCDIKSEITRNLEQKKAKSTSSCGCA